MYIKRNHLICLRKPPRRSCGPLRVVRVHNLLCVISKKDSLRKAKKIEARFAMMVSRCPDGVFAHRNLHASSVPDLNSQCHCLALVLQQLSIYTTQARASFIICAFIFICKVQIPLTTMKAGRTTRTCWQPPAFVPRPSIFLNTMQNNVYK